MSTIMIEKTAEEHALLPTEVNDQSKDTLNLKDGRTLGYAQYGDPSGKPVFFFHGGAGSRLEHPVDRCAIDARLICVDRPGHGLSEFQPNRKLLDWPDDVAQLADHLGIDRFHILGWSAGGPHALACAYKLSQRVLAGAVMAGLSSMNRSGATKGFTVPAKVFFLSANYFPWLIKQFRKLAHDKICGDYEEAKELLLSSIPVDDKKHMIQSGNLEMWLADVREGYRQGWKGVAHDDIVIMRDWGFDIGDIEVCIDIWHGDQDRNIPIQASAYMHDRIPNTSITFLRGEGHLFPLRHWEKVLHSLIYG